jgi:transcriptional regulator with XRE-family HTH domain
MRVSPRSHTLAVLRILVGLTQKEMAEALECSAPTIQAIELGKLKMSDRLAEVCSLKTGISLDWLLKNDVTQPPVDVMGNAYTKSTFEAYQAHAGFQQDQFGGALSTVFCRSTNISRLEALILRAYTDDKMPLCAYKIAQAFTNLEQEFGVTVQDHIAVGSPLGMPKESFKDFDLNKFLQMGNLRTKSGKLNFPERTRFERAISIEGNRKWVPTESDVQPNYKITQDGRVFPVIATNNKQPKSKPKKT